MESKFRVLTEKEKQELREDMQNASKCMRAILARKEQLTFIELLLRRFSLHFLVIHQLQT